MLPISFLFVKDPICFLRAFDCSADNGKTSGSVFFWIKKSHHSPLVRKILPNLPETPDLMQLTHLLQVVGPTCIKLVDKKF